jgi:hypothetical protein
MLLVRNDHPQCRIDVDDATRIYANRSPRVSARSELLRETVDHLQAKEDYLCQRSWLN